MRPQRLTSSAATSNTRLRVQPGVMVLPTTVVRYQDLFRDNEVAIPIFEDVTTRLTGMFELAISRQQLHPSHVFSQMACFGRTKLTAMAIKRFLAHLRRRHAWRHVALPEEFRRRYERAQSPLFVATKNVQARLSSRQQAAEDLQWIIECFAKDADVTVHSSYKALVTIFDQDCELSEGKVVLKAKTSGDRAPASSADDGSDDAHEGQGLQVARAVPPSPVNDARLIVGVLCAEGHRRGGAPLLDQLVARDRPLRAIPAVPFHGGDENALAAEPRGLAVAAPAPGPKPRTDQTALSRIGFAAGERTGLAETTKQNTRRSGDEPTESGLAKPLKLPPSRRATIRRRSAILICGLGLAAGSLYLLQQFQVSRLARSVDEQAADALKAGNFEKAVTLYSEHLAVTPDDVDVQIKYADSLLQGSPTPNQQATALEIFDEVLEQYPGREDLRRRRAELRFAVGNLSEADTQAELQILLDSPQGKRDGHLLFLLGRCCEVNRNDARAKICYEAAIENQAPEKIDAYERLASLLRQPNRLNKPQAADQVIDAMVWSAPDDYHVYVAQPIPPPV